MQKILRQSNIELLRIVLMLMIITHHIIFHGFGLGKFESPDFTFTPFAYFKIAINSFVIVAVNVFVFISGYYGIKFKLSTVFSLLLQAIFYSVIFYFIAVSLNYNKLTFQIAYKSFLPISTSIWWFFTTYIGLYFISPFLNKGVEFIEKRELQYILIGLLFLNSFSGFFYGSLSSNGYSIFSFIVIYLIARYLKTYNVTISKPFVWYFIISIAIFSFTVYYVNVKNFAYARRVFHYNNPLIVASSVFLFFTFKNLAVRSHKLINSLAGATFAVYLIHDYYTVRDALGKFIRHLYRILGDSPLTLTLIIISLILLIFIASVTIEKLRVWLFVQISTQYHNRFSKSKIKE